MSFDDSAYRGLIELGENNEALKRLNSQAINIFQNEGMSRAICAMQKSIKNLPPICIDDSIARMMEPLKKAVPNANVIALSLSDSMQRIAEQYKQLFSSYDFTRLADNIRVALEQSQMSSIAQLCLSYETTMIHDAISCFANARYEYLPDVFNTAMSKDKIGAADVAFIKTGKIIPIIETELIYPRGFKSSLAALHKVTAEDISDNADIEYDTKSNHFLTLESTLDSKGMNIVCSGIETIGSDDMFTEVELMDFISILSRTPMAGALVETGKKIHEWLRELYDRQFNMMDFDYKIYYHSRSRKIDSMPFTFDEMKKAPYGLPGAGRFNPVGRAHFYFSNTQKGAESEVKKHLQKDDVLQTVRLKPVRSIRILDLSDKLQRGATFLRMMRYPLRDENNKMPKEYLLPCYVADCCQMIGYDGIKYYGSKEYSNYVSWSDGYFEDAGMCG